MNEPTKLDQTGQPLPPKAVAVEKAVRDSVRNAIEKHRKLGMPMVDWRDGQVVWVPAEELPPTSGN